MTKPNYDGVPPVQHLACVFRNEKAAVEDSSGPEVASDRALWRNLLDSAKLLRERLSADPKSSVSLKPGCCDADPAFKHSLEVTL